LKPLNRLEIRDLNLEIEGRLAKTSPLKPLAIVRSFMGRKCYGIGLSDPKRDLILRNFGRTLANQWYPSESVSPTYTIKSIDGVDRTIRMLGSTSDVAFYSGSYQTLGSLLGFGNPATAPTPAREDYEIASKVAQINPSSAILDEVNWRITVTGSYVWVAGGTVRCAGQYWDFEDTGNIHRVFLIFYDAVSDVIVPAGGTVSVTYKTQL